MKMVKKIINVISNAYVEDDVKNIAPADIIASISYFFNFLHDVGDTDDIDHLGNRRCVLLVNFYKINLELVCQEWNVL